MIGAVGGWLFVIGYALVYTGVSYFANSKTAPSLAQSLGLQSNTVGATTTDYVPNNNPSSTATTTLDAATAASGGTVGLA